MKRFKSITDGRSGPHSEFSPFDKAGEQRDLSACNALESDVGFSGIFEKNEAEIDNGDGVVIRPPHGTRVFQSPSGFFG